MSKPATRDQFKQFCLRKVGMGAITVNVTEEQIDDRIDEAIAYYLEYHFEGSERTFYAYGPVTQTDINNTYIPLPTNILGAVSIFPLSTALSTNSLFNIRYQIALNDLYTFTSVSMVPYYMAFEHIQLLEQLLVGVDPIRFNKKEGKLWIDTDWSLVEVGQYFIVEAFKVIDPDTYPLVWQDWWLQNYCTALIKQQMGEHLKKMGNVPMPGGVTYNGKEIYDEATAQIEKLQDWIQRNTFPSVMMVG